MNKFLKLAESIPFPRSPNEDNWLSTNLPLFTLCKSCLDKWGLKINESDRTIIIIINRTITYFHDDQPPEGPLNTEMPVTYNEEITLE